MAIGSPFSASEAARPCSERPRGVRGVRRPFWWAWRQWGCLCGKLFARRRDSHRSKQRKPGRQRASFTLAERSCVCSTSPRKGVASRYDVLAPQDARPGPNPLTAPLKTNVRTSARPLTPSARSRSKTTNTLPEQPARTIKVLEARQRVQGKDDERELHERRERGPRA